DGREIAGHVEHVGCFLDAPPRVLLVAGLVIRDDDEIQVGGVHAVTISVPQRAVARSVERDLGVTMHLAAVDLVYLSVGADGVVADAGYLLLLLRFARQSTGRLGRTVAERNLRHTRGAHARELDVVIAGRLAESGAAVKLVIGYQRHEGVALRVGGCRQFAFVAALRFGKHDQARPTVAAVIGGADFPLPARGPLA